MDAKKLNIGCGNVPLRGYINIDKYYYPGSPAPLNDNELANIWNINYPDSQWGYGDAKHLELENDFFDEVFRCLKPGGTIRTITPYYANGRAFQDPLHRRFITEATFLYLTKAWRKMNKLEHYPVKCDFEIVKIDHAISEEYNGRAQEAIQHAALHSWNVVNDILVTLRKPK